MGAQKNSELLVRCSSLRDAYLELCPHVFGSGAAAEEAVGQSFEKDSQTQSLKDEYQLDMEKTVEPLVGRKEAKESIKSAKEVKNRSFRQSLAKKRNVPSPRTANTIAANTIEPEDYQLGLSAQSQQLNQSIESGEVFLKSASAAKSLDKIEATKSYSKQKTLEENALAKGSISKIQKLSEEASINNDNMEPIMTPLSYHLFRNHFQPLQLMLTLRVIQMSGAT